MNVKVMLLVVGLVVGAGIGWFTVPKPAAEIHAGPLNMTVQNDNGSGGSMTVTGKDGGLQVEVGKRSAFDDPGLRTAIFAGIAAIVGLGAGYLIDMRKG